MLYSGVYNNAVIAVVTVRVKNNSHCSYEVYINDYSILPSGNVAPRKLNVYQVRAEGWTVKPTCCNRTNVVTFLR